MQKITVVGVLAVGFCSMSSLAAQPKVTDAIATRMAGMTHATPISAKIGAPVDVYYKHLTAGKTAQDPSLQLAFVPRLGGKLQVEFIPDQSVSIDYGGAPLAMQKTTAAGVYNRMLSVRRVGGTAASIRALVSVEIDGARFTSIFSIPVDAASAASLKKTSGKPPREPAKQR